MEAHWQFTGDMDYSLEKLRDLFGRWDLVEPFERLTDDLGKPLEFRCTAPVKPNAVQRTLYGQTLFPLRNSSCDSGVSRLIRYLTLALFSFEEEENYFVKGPRIVALFCSSQMANPVFRSNRFTSPYRHVAKRPHRQ